MKYLAILSILFAPFFLFAQSETNIPERPKHIVPTIEWEFTDPDSSEYWFIENIEIFMPDEDAQAWIADREKKYGIKTVVRNVHCVFDPMGKKLTVEPGVGSFWYRSNKPPSEVWRQQRNEPKKL